MSRVAMEAVPVDTLELSESGGVAARVLSVDDSDPAERSLLVETSSEGRFELPAGRSSDVFVLRGEVQTEAGERIGRGDYAYLSGASGTSRVLRHTAGAQYFVAIGSVEASASGEDLVVDPRTVPWHLRVQENCDLTLGGSSFHVVKFLRVDEVNQITVGMGAQWPDSGLDCAEYHEQIDEVLHLSGDLLVREPSGQPVVADRLSYFWRPSNMVHLPKYSLRGNLQFFRNMKVLWSEHGAATFVEVPEWPSIVADYRGKHSAGSVL